MKIKYMNAKKIHCLILFSSIAWQGRSFAEQSQAQKLAALQKKLAEELARSQKLSRDYSSLRNRVGKNPGYDSTEKFSASIDKMWEKMQAAARVKELTDFKAILDSSLSEVRAWDPNKYIDGFGTEFDELRSAASGVLQASKVKHEQQIAELKDEFSTVMRRLCLKLDTDLVSKVCP